MRKEDVDPYSDQYLLEYDQFIRGQDRPLEVRLFIRGKFLKKLDRLKSEGYSVSDITPMDEWRWGTSAVFVTAKKCPLT